MLLQEGRGYCSAQFCGKEKDGQSSVATAGAIRSNLARGLIRVECFAYIAFLARKMAALMKCSGQALLHPG